jgi:hypothetical protein
VSDEDRSSADQVHWVRIERKVDQLREAITQLVRVEERQMSHGQRLGALEQDMAAARAHGAETRSRLESWINRGIGLWALAVTMWTIWLALGERFLR